MRTSEQIKLEIEERFGFFPPFFDPAQQNPQVLENLWQQMLSAYVNNPLPTLFKEKLCAYLSRYCAVPYCLVYHICSLRASGMTAQQVIGLLELPPPGADDIENQLRVLAAQPNPLTLSKLNSDLEQSLLSCAIFIFLERQGVQVHAKLQHLVGTEFYQHLIALVAYLKTYFLWMEGHPEVDYAADKRVQAHLVLLEDPGLADFLQHYRQQQECHEQGSDKLSCIRIGGVRREAPVRREVRNKENLSPPHPRTPAPRILLVEDNADMRDYLKFLLQERFEVEALEDGVAALESVRHRVPDLVLSDVMMPRLDGFELLRELRSNSHTKDVPFILLSALTDVDSTIKGLEAGADDYLGKPFSPRELFARVGANLELVRMRQEVHYERAARIEAEHARKELEKLNQLKDDFLSTVSHELRTPMTNIKMAIQMLQVVNTPDLHHRYMQILQVECTREIDLINNLLDLQRLESGTAAVEWSQFQLQEWLVPIVEPFIERSRSHQQTLRLDISPLPHLLSDPVSLERIVAELLNNACKYTPKGGEITITARPKQFKPDSFGGVELIVSNSGCEIPESELVRIFEKFYRVQNSDPWKQGGTGLGLALVQKLVELLGGRIRAESRANKVTFTVELPGNNL